MCDVCKELTQNKDTVKIHELYENTSGYFYPENEMIIKYCPCCGKELNAERKSATMTKEELIKGLHCIRAIIETYKEDYPMQTENQLKVIDEIIEILSKEI